MASVDLKKHFSPEFLKRSLRYEEEYGWRINDVSAVIEAGRKAGLATVSARLQIFIPDDLGGGVCSDHNVQFVSYRLISPDLSWAEQIEQTADMALAEFERLKTESDLLEEGEKLARDILIQLGAPDADMENMLGFVLNFCDAPISLERKSEKTDEEKIIEDATKAFYRQRDPHAARALVRPLAEQGNPVAQVLMGKTCVDTDGKTIPEEEIKWYRKAAAQDHAQAWYLLHMNYMWGRGVEKDMKEAANCLRKAAEQGHVMACSFLGQWFRLGTGVVLDYEEAFKWLKQAASYGRPESQGELGEMYRRGAGIPRDYEEAYFWLSLAVRTPWNYAFLPRRQEAAKHLSAEQIETVKKRVAEWKKVVPPEGANTPYFNG